jgi:hypothetical protein
MSHRSRRSPPCRWVTAAIQALEQPIAGDEMRSLSLPRCSNSRDFAYYVREFTYMKLQSATNRGHSNMSALMQSATGSRLWASLRSRFGRIGHIRRSGYLEERLIVSGAFGTVTTKQVIYQHLKGWMFKGYREDIALNNVTSVRLKIWRPRISGLSLLLAASWMLACPPPAGIRHAVGAGFLLLGTLLIWGSPTIWLTTSNDEHAATGWPWQRRQAEDFVEAIRQQILRR